MASRESQGLQVALILFVMVTVVLAVTTYVYFRKSEEKIREAASARAESRQAQEAVMAMQFENQILKHVLGYEPKTNDELTGIKSGLGSNKAEMEQVLASYDQDMAMYGAGFGGQTLNYRTLPEYLITAIGVRNRNLSDADAREKALQRERDHARESEAKRTAKAEADLKTAQSDLVSVRNQFNADRTRVTDEKTKLAALLPVKDTEIKRLSTESKRKVDTLEKSMTQMQLLNEAYRAKLEGQKETTFETPDGEVVWVNQRSNVVWINLGSADGLQRQITFSVYDQAEIGVDKGEIKGRIEVTRIMEPNMAEARIIEDNLTNPILDGDKIYSPSFRKGQKTRFALAGLLDIDGDGRSDQEKLKSIITTNGGAVDAELLEDGSIAGKMTLDTHYLVKGERPTDKTNQKRLDGYSRIIEDGSRLGIQTMSLNALLDRMGYAADRRVEHLDRGGSGGSSQFRKRTPGSAY